mmetsp:Transcript_918/g.3647  ORF Transcript_918/g.3647 Transcript_918/m.3647 type:complete len:235 (+) Transcript_918:373-1077(+)
MAQRELQDGRFCGQHDDGRTDGQCLEDGEAAAPRVRIDRRVGDGLDRQDALARGPLEEPEIPRDDVRAERRREPLEVRAFGALEKQNRRRWDAADDLSQRGVEVGMQLLRVLQTREQRAPLFSGIDVDLLQEVASPEARRRRRARDPDGPRIEKRELLGIPLRAVPAVVLLVAGRVANDPPPRREVGLEVDGRRKVVDRVGHARGDGVAVAEDKLRRCEPGERGRVGQRREPQR